MGYLLLGFVLGVAVSWFWQAQFSDLPIFQGLLRKEQFNNNQPGSVTVLKKRLEIMEKRLTEIENRPDREDTVDDQVDTIKPQLNIVAKTGNVYDSSGQVSVKDRKETRKKVLAMWKTGKTVSEIASRNHLGKGEVELIIAMQEGAAIRDKLQV
jgi:hypothetical protein